LTKVLADDLGKKQFSSLVEFLKSASVGKFACRGKRIEIKILTKKKAKFLLRKFLHGNRLSEYHLLDTGDALEVVCVKSEPERRMRKSLPLKHPVHYGPPVPLFSLSRD
jgi:hypothetical protein